MLALILVGAADSVSTIIRNTIRQLQTPDYIRGRMTSINQIFFMGGPQLGRSGSRRGGAVLRSAVGSDQRRGGLHPGGRMDHPPLAADCPV